MNEMINNLGNRMVTLMRVVNIDRVDWSKDERRFTETKPSTKFDYELQGMCMAMTAMDIPFEFTYDDQVVEYLTVTIMGTKFVVYPE